MRIVYLWDADYPWDVRTEKVCLALTEAGHEVHVVARNRQWRPVRERLPEGTVHRMRPWRWLGRRLDGALGFPAFMSPRWISLLARAVREARAYVIVARDLPLCPTAILVGRLFRVPVVFDMAENYPALVRQLWAAGRQGRWDRLLRNPAAAAAVERFCLPRVDRVIAVVPESAARVVRAGVPASRVSVVGNTPPRDRVGRTPPRVLRAAGEPLRLVYMGVMEVPRGILELLDAVAALRGRGEDVRLCLIGTGRDKALLEAHAAKLGLDGQHVEFTGWIASHAEALERVAAADVGVIPHRRDEAWDTTIPNKLFDFMAAGLPVLASDAVPTARIIRETGCGLVHRSRDAESIARALLALRNPELRALLGDAGREAILTHYHWEADAAVLVETVEAAVEERASAISRRAIRPSARVGWEA